MAIKHKIPWLDYAGQDTAEILVCHRTHRIDSLLRALEQGIGLRQTRIPDVATTPEEYTLLAIMALQREVNNGGYHQFNSSCKYALTCSKARTLPRINPRTMMQRTAPAWGGPRIAPKPPYHITLDTE